MLSRPLHVRSSLPTSKSAKHKSKSKSTRARARAQSKSKSKSAKQEQGQCKGRAQRTCRQRSAGHRPTVLKRRQCEQPEVAQGVEAFS